MARDDDPPDRRMSWTKIVEKGSQRLYERVAGPGGSVDNVLRVQVCAPAYARGTHGLY
jgi:hypothetical protein